MNEFDIKLTLLLSSNQSDAIEGAANFFYKHYEKSLNAHVRKRGLTTEDAQEIIAEIFLGLQKIIHGQKLEKTCDHYVWGTVTAMVAKKHRIRSNAKIDYYENLEATVQLSSASQLQEETSWHDTLAWWEAHSDMVLQQLLNPKEQQLVQDHFYEFKKIKDIASQRTENRGTVSKRKSDLLFKLRNFIITHLKL